MGLSYICDCCQKPVDHATEIGYVNKAYYCDDCLSEYEKYRISVNEYHTGVTEIIKKRLQEIKDKWLENHPGAKLPE